MPFGRVYPEKFGELWVANYPLKRNFTVPVGKIAAWTSRLNVPDTTLIATGLTHVPFNDGMSSHLNHSQSAVFISNPEPIKAINPNKPLSQFTDDECALVGPTYLAAHGDTDHKIGVVTTALSESNPSTRNWTQDFSGAYTGVALPHQYHIIDQSFATALGSDCLFFGNYDGIGTCRQTIDNAGAEALRSGYQSDENAWNYMHSHSPFGNPFFTDNAYTYRHGLVNNYWAGSTDARRRIFAMASDMLFSKYALAYKNSDKKIISFVFNKSEFINRSELVTRSVGGGIASNYGFVTYGQGVSSIMTAISMVLSDGVYMWEDSLRYGLNKDRVSLGISSYTGSPDNLAHNRYYEYTNSDDVPYPGGTEIGHCHMLSGIEFYCRAVGWAGPTWNYAPSRIVNGTFNVVNREYMLNTYVSNQPVGFLFKIGNRRALLSYSFHEVGTQVVYEWDCDGEVVPIKMDSGILYLHLGEISN